MIQLLLFPFVYLIVLISVDGSSLSSASISSSLSLRGGSNHDVKQKPQEQRRLQSVSILSSSLSSTTTTAATTPATSTATKISPYYITRNLGTLYQYDVTLGNPLKGLATDISRMVDTGVQSSLQAFYFPFNAVVMGPKLYNWTMFENYLADAASRSLHVIPRFFIAYPGQDVALPPYYIDRVPMRPYTDSGVVQYTPYFGDPLLLSAIQQFIMEFGKRYDGDKRIAFIQAGLLGFWGEWSILGNTAYLPDSSKDLVNQWYNAAFNITRIQVRNPSNASITAKMGYHDDSFTYSTIDGPANGNVYGKYYFWNKIVAARVTDFWKYNVMGGEVRPENVDHVFQSDYPVGTQYHQDFMLCANITHATYMKHGFLFRDTMMLPDEINNANRASVRMGYNYQIIEIAVSNATSKMRNAVDIQVAVQQIGIAPFYYPLFLNFTCPSFFRSYRSVGGLEKLIELNSFEYYTFTNIPATSACLSSIRLSLYSPWLLPNQTIAFAQSIGSTGTVAVALPLPGSPQSLSQALFLRTHAPTPAPVNQNSYDETDDNLYVNVILINSVTDTDIGPVYSDDDMSDCYDVEPMDIAQLGTTLSIRAMVVNASRISFKWYENNKPSQTIETVAPYSMCSDMNGDYKACYYLTYPGVKSIRITAQDASNNVIAQRTVTFTMIKSNNTTPSTPTATINPPIPSAVRPPILSPAVNVPIPSPAMRPTMPISIVILPAPTAVVPVAASPAVVTKPTTPITIVTVPAPTPAVIKPTIPISIVITAPTTPAAVPKPTSLVIVPAPTAVAGPKPSPLLSFLMRLPPFFNSRDSARTYPPTSSSTTSEEESGDIEFYLVNTATDWDLGRIKPHKVYSRTTNSKLGTELTIYADILTTPSDDDIAYVILYYKDDQSNNWIQSSPENQAPFSLAGLNTKNKDLLPSPYFTTPGMKKIKATAYNDQNNAILSSTIQFEIQQ